MYICTCCVNMYDVRTCTGIYNIYKYKVYYIYIQVDYVCVCAALSVALPVRTYGYAAAFLNGIKVSTRTHSSCYVLVHMYDVLVHSTRTSYIVYKVDVLVDRCIHLPSPIDMSNGASKECIENRNKMDSASR